MTTVVDLLVAGREQIKKGYTADAYIGAQDKDGDEWIVPADSPADVRKLIKGNKNQKVVVCAVGGVEHALFALTGKFIGNVERATFGGLSDGQWWRDHSEDNKLGSTRSRRLKLYHEAMDLLNKVAKEQGYVDVEAPNLDLPLEESKPIVLDIYRRAIRRARAAERRQPKKAVAA